MFTRNAKVERNSATRPGGVARQIIQEIEDRHGIAIAEVRVTRIEPATRTVQTASLSDRRKATQPTRQWSRNPKLIARKTPFVGGRDSLREDVRVSREKTAPNRVLAGIPQKDYERLLPALEPVVLRFGQVLYDAGERMRYVYFPVDCLISLLTAVDKRRTLEVGMVGNEGMVGIPYIFGVGDSTVRALVQGGGTALRMSSASFRTEFKQNLLLQQALYRYTYALMAQISQTAACNRFHNAEQRLSRWLLMTRDRVRSNKFPLTQEFLAHMLGVRREGVTEAAGALRRRKLIGYHRGNVEILNSKGLEAASCTCYATVKNVSARAHR
jgi:CRP-like cAMP-binding protein